MTTGSKRSSLTMVWLLAVIGVTCLLLLALVGYFNKPNQTANTPPTSQPTANASPEVAQAVTEGVEEEPTDIPEATIAPTETPAPTEAPATVPGVGERSELSGVALTAVSVEKKEQLGQFFTAKEGMVYVVVEVLIENTARETLPYNPLYFKVKDSDGFEYPAGFANDPDGALSAGELPKGDKVRGKVTFEVKESATGLVLSFAPLVIGEDYETIRIALGQ